MDNLIIPIIIIIIFLILREFWCWYWKINKINDLLQKKLDEQERTNILLERLLKEKNKDK